MVLLVTGPSGNVGAELVQMLTQDSSRPWRVASRHPDALASTIADPNIDIVELDFFNPRTWASALKNIDQLFLLFPLPGNKAARQAIIPFVHAAAAMGCRHAVYVSVLGADKARFIPHYKVEAALRQQIPKSTILQCGFFMQNLHRAISTHGVDIADHHELFIPAGRGKTTFLDAADAAAVAAVVLQDPVPHYGKTYRLTGSESLAMGDVADQLTRALGYDVRYTHPGLISFARRLRKRGVGYDTIAFMGAVYTLTRLGLNQDITADVHNLLSREPNTLRVYLRESAWRWRQQAWT